MGKVIVKHWVGYSNDDRKATYREFQSKKDAVQHIKDMRKLHGREIQGAANFYEIFKKGDL